MLSQTSEYALRALACMAVRPENFFTAGSLASQTKAPQDYMAKVLQQLAIAGLVSGRRGVGGGYCMARPPEEIKLTQVIDAISPTRRIEPWVDGQSDGASVLRTLQQTVDAAVGAAWSALDSKTLADLIPNGHGARASA